MMSSADLLGACFVPDPAALAEADPPPPVAFCPAEAASMVWLSPKGSKGAAADACIEAGAAASLLWNASQLLSCDNAAIAGASGWTTLACMKAAQSPVTQQ